MASQLLEKQSAPWVIRTPDLLIRSPIKDDEEKPD
jgi:hypothetical protein